MLILTRPTLIIARPALIVKKPKLIISRPALIMTRSGLGLAVGLARASSDGEVMVTMLDYVTAGGIARWIAGGFFGLRACVPHAHERDFFESPPRLPKSFCK